jgi:quercetin dioxygenase-like cupin family protein
MISEHATPASYSNEGDQMEDVHSLVPGTTFDLAPIAAELRGEGVYERDGHTARTLVREMDLRVVLVVMRSGGIIKEHLAHETASIHMLSGHVRVRLRDRLVDLPSGGRLLVLEAGLPHTVEAVDESAFLLTLGWRPKP